MASMMLEGQASRGAITNISCEVPFNPAVVSDGLATNIVEFFAVRPKSYDAGIRGKPLGERPPNPLSLVLTEGVRGSHRVAPMMPKGEAFRADAPNISS